MGAAKRRKQFLQALATAPVPDSGLFLLSRRDGVALILAAKPANGGIVDAALFCVDEWQEGLFQCLGQRFQSLSSFQHELRSNGEGFRLASPQDCAQRVAWGESVHRRAGVALTPKYEHWKFLLEPSIPSAHVEALFGCPECGALLPQALQKTLLESVGTKQMCYFVCQECIRSKRHRSVEEAGFPHRRLIEPFLEADGFSLDPSGDSGRWMMSMPGDTHREAVALMLQRDGDPVRAAATAVEFWVIPAARPNTEIEDRHIRNAIANLLATRTPEAPTPEEGSPEVAWVTRAAKEGMAAFAAAAGSALGPAEQELAMTQGLQKVLTSIRRHESPLHARRYIDYVSRFIK